MIYLFHCGRVVTFRGSRAHALHTRHTWCSTLNLVRVSAPQSTTKITIMPRKKTNPNSDNVYVSEPAKKQKYFPHRRQTVNRKRVSLPKTRSQTSLTQIQYVIELPASGEHATSDIEDAEPAELALKDEQQTSRSRRTSNLEKKTKSKTARTIAEVPDSDAEDDWEESYRPKKRHKRGQKLEYSDDEWAGGTTGEARAPRRGSGKKSGREQKSEATAHSRKLMTEEERREYHRLTQMMVNGRPFVSSGSLAFTDDIPDQIPESAQKPYDGRHSPRKLRLGLHDEDIISEIQSVDSELEDNSVTRGTGSAQPAAPPTNSSRHKETKAFKPQTPDKRRILEIPSSQSPAVTPFLTQSARSLRSQSRSPLLQRSANIPEKIDTPSKKRSVRFNLHEDTTEDTPRSTSVSKRNEVQYPTPHQRAGLRISRPVIKDAYSDSEDESIEDHDSLNPNSQHVQCSSSSDAIPEHPDMNRDADDKSRDETPRVEESPIRPRPTPMRQGDIECQDSSDVSTISEQEALSAETASEEGDADLDTTITNVEGTIGLQRSFEEESQADSASAQLLSDILEYNERQNSGANGPTMDKQGQHILRRERTQVHSSPEILGDPIFRPSQVSTVDITQTSIRRSSKEPQSLRFSSPPLPPLTQMPSLPTQFPFPPPPQEPLMQVPASPDMARFIQIPSSPLPLPPSSASGYSGIATQNTQFRRPLTVSQLLPESLLQLDIPPLPDSTQSNPFD